MGLAKYAEELRDKALEAGEAEAAPQHPALVCSLSRPGRSPERLSPADAEQKRQSAEARIDARRQRQADARKKAAVKRDRELSERAKRLMAALQPKLVEANERLSKQNERLQDHLRMMNAALKAKSEEIAALKSERFGR